MKKISRYGLGVICALLALACSNTTTSERSSFTRADSLTEKYLNLQDSVYQVWNLLLKQEHQKIQSMRTAVDQLMQSNQEDFSALKKQLEQLERIQYNHKTVSNNHVVFEYDQASGQLMHEILTNLNSQVSPSVTNNLRSSIITTHQQILEYRQLYNLLAFTFNQFVEQHENVLKEIDANSNLQRKPLFSEPAGREPN